MGAAASVSMGNKTESNVTNSTSNEQYFKMENIVSITNSMNQKTLNVNAIASKIDQKSNNKVSLKVKGMKVSGKGNVTTISANASSEQKAEAIAEATAVVEHVSNLTDAVMFDIANNGFSQQSSDMSSAASASSTTELEVSGLGVAAASVGINNTVCTNVNNSIRNVFSMAVNNNMSSATDRASLAESVNSATGIINQISSGEVGLEIEDLDIGGEKNTTTITAAAASGMGATLQETLTSNLTSSLTAITNTVASATSTVEASQKAKSSATATASQTQSTKLSTDSAIWAIAAAVMVGAICTAVIGVAKCSGKKNNTTIVVNNPANNSEQQPIQQ